MPSLTGLSLRNVRLFFGVEAQQFSLKPLTILAGTNSSGKSTVLKTLSLIRQSQGIGEANDLTHARLKFKGSLVDMGNFGTLHSDTNLGEPLQIGFTVSGTQTTAWKRWLTSTAGATTAVPYKVQAGDDVSLPVSIEVKLIFVAGENGKTGLLKEGRITIDHGGDIYSVVYRRAANAENTPGENLFELIVPAAFVYAGPLQNVAGGILSDDKSTFKYQCQVKGLLPAVLFARGSNGVQATTVWINGPLPPYLNWVIEHVKVTLHKIHYLGPLRSSPKRYYQVDWDDRPGLDPVGEFLPFVLRTAATQKVLNQPPAGGATVTEPLAKALNHWLAYFRTGSLYDYDHAADEYGLAEANAFVEVSLTSDVTGRKHPLVDSGFGLSQVFPVLTRCLLADKEELIIVEQPELHLHPALQVRLGEFFAAMVLAGKRILIETHSEHIVNSIRAIIAERPTSELAGKTVIYFLHATSGTVSIRNMSLNNDGSLTEWPREFFGEALELSARILKAQRAQRQDSSTSS